MQRNDKYLDKEKHNQAGLNPQSNVFKWSYKDTVAVFAFLFISIAYNISVWNGNTPYYFLTGDAANIASFAAALDNPESFKKDELLSNPGNFKFYMTVHIPVLRWLNTIFHGYGTAFIFLLWIHIFMQCMGFYLFGRLLLESRTWAFLLSCILLIRINTSLGDFWGTFYDPIPRVSFQALLPYLLIAAFLWRRKWKVWPVLMVFCGALMYVHPVSAPPWMFAIWIGFFWYLPENWSVIKKASFMSVMAIISLATAFPFLSNYLSNHVHGKTIDYKFVHDVMDARFIQGYLNAFSALKKTFLIPDVFMLSAGGLISTIIIIMKKNKLVIPVIHLCTIWGFGVMVISVVIPFSEQLLSRLFHTVPVEVDLIRGIRFVIPLSIIAIFALFRTFQKESRIRFIRYASLKAAFLLTVTLSLYHYDTLYLSTVLKWGQGEFFTPWYYERDRNNLIDFIKTNTASDASIFLGEHGKGFDGLCIRYAALRPVLYEDKDGGAFAYANIEGLKQWWRKRNEILEANTKPTQYEKFSSLCQIAKSYNADYLIYAQSSLPSHWPLNVQPVYLNSSWALIKM